MSFSCAGLTQDLLQGGKGALAISRAHIHRELWRVCLQQQDLGISVPAQTHQEQEQMGKRGGS